MNDVFKEVFGFSADSLKGEDPASKLLEAVEKNAELRVRIEKLKNKSRTLIDRSWNKAIDEAISAVECGEDLSKLKRRVR